VGGTYTLDGATGTNTGTVTVKNGGVIKSVATITGAGINTVEQGGTVYFNDGTGEPFIGTDSSAIFQLGANGKFSYNNDSYTVEGSVTLNDTDGVANDPPDVWIIGDEQVLTITRGGTLTIGTNAVLGLGHSNAATTAPVVGDLAGTGELPKIVFTDTGIGVFNWSSTYKYFYPNGGTTGGEPQLDTTYEWKANVNSTGNAGWEATS
jgi:hypothetical protein